MYKCAQQYGMKFRLSWHWNAAAGDPTTPWTAARTTTPGCVTNARRELIPTIHFERDIREGIDDYRYMLTLSRLLREKPNHPEAAAARRLLDTNWRPSIWASATTTPNGRKASTKRTAVRCWKPLSN